MPTTAKLWIVAVATVLGTLAGFGSGWAVNGWRWSAKYSEQASTFATTRQRETTAAAERFDRLVKERDGLAAKLQTLDDASRKALEDIQHENTRLHDCVRAGTCGVRIVAARCPSVQANGPAGPTSSPVVDPGTGPRLDDAVQSDILDLRAGIKSTLTQLDACQGQLRARTALTAK